MAQCLQLAGGKRGGNGGPGGSKSRLQARPRARQITRPTGGAQAKVEARGRMSRILEKQGTPASRTRAQQAKHGGASTTARMVDIDAASTVVAAPETSQSAVESASNGKLRNKPGCGCPRGAAAGIGRCGCAECEMSEREETQELLQRCGRHGAIEVNLFHTRDGDWWKGAQPLCAADGVGYRIGHLDYHGDRSGRYATEFPWTSYRVTLRRRNLGDCY